MRAFFKALPRRLRRPGRHRLQILSDLHLEVGQQYSTFAFPATAPFLLLAGDIGRLVDYNRYLCFLQALASRYQKVFLVLGNHEFYGMDYESGLVAAHRLSEEPSLANTLVLLDKARWDDPNSNLTILGCTLWSAIPDEACGLVESKVNDFKKIIGWTARKHNKVHADEVAWLRHQIARNSDAKRLLVVATHHAPCLEGTSQPGHSDNPWSSAFATDILTEGGWDDVKIWAFGHTHYSTDLTLPNGIRLVANQRGYVLPGNAMRGAVSSKTKKGAHDFYPGMSVALEQ
ncbi:calcineurin-like phosphoesterase [Hirsutella rhossiliensis]|uniref:Calcineurin-like phosphoesterase domain-containing protein n=1 Tax=Hirsutella rhossiliensis TaxID=111463 RepID=A0A9P8MWL0_9HYPO|nr:calcineurin-like phosphoesterase domain-containing protein [Hirsutella rhossiliensis]KAH0962702.1 calcineurin-like phosphoesterase domain-containing protein [Hirsutella rhossiliensis]